MSEKTILIVDDEQLIRKVLDVKLESLDYKTLLAEDGPEALKLLETNQVDIVFCDVFLPGMSGFDVLKEIKKKYKDKIMVIIMTAYANLKTAVKAFEFGAFDYLIKPFTMEEIPYVINKALKFKELLNENKKQKKEKRTFSEIAGVSDYILKIKKQLNNLIHDFSPCLIQGGPGTGKKHIAKIIAKYLSGKLNDNFYYINLLGFSKNKEQLINTIFNKNFINEFNTNIVIVDNIHLIDLSLQETALKNFNNKIKYIFITNKKINIDNYKHYFSTKFYNLFKENTLQTIPLKEHKEDIPLLIQHFIKTYNKKYNKSLKDIDKDSFYYLLYYNWTDNIRELESIIEKVVLLAEGKTITSDLLYDFIKEQKDLKVIFLNPRLSYKDAFQEAKNIIDKHYFNLSLKNTNNNKTKAAKSLRISLRQFQYRCKSLGL